MKTIHFIFFLFFSYSMLQGQQSQSILASKYQDGQYAWHKNQTGLYKDPESYEEDGYVELKFTKNSAGEVEMIHAQYDGETEWIVFLPDAYQMSSFVRYYRCKKDMSNRCLYFTDKAMWMVDIDKEEKDQGVAACLGKKAVSGKGFLAGLSAYLAESWEIQNEERKHCSVFKQEIAKLSVETVFDGEPASGKEFKIGVTTTLKDGTVIKSKCLGGKQPGSEYSISVSGAVQMNSDKETDEPEWFADYCEKNYNQKIKGKIIVSVFFKKFLLYDTLDLACQYSQSYLDAQAEKERQLQAITVVSEYVNGLAIAKKGDGKFGFVDANKKVVVEPIYTKVQPFGSEGLARVEISGKFGFVNKVGKEVIPVIYNASFDKFSEGLMGVQLNGKQGFVDINGKVVIPIEHQKVLLFDKDGLSYVKKNDLWGAYNAKGTLVMPVVYQGISDFDAVGLARVKKDGKYGFVNKSGKELIPVMYDGSYDVFADGLVGAKLNGKQGFLDATGKTVIAFEYDQVLTFGKGVAVVRKGDLWGLINTKGEAITPLAFKRLEAFNENGLALVQKDDLHGYINRQGKEIIPIIYQAGGVAFERGVTGVKKDGKWALIDEKGTFITDFIYPKLGKFNKEGITCASNDKELFGMINTQGQTVLAFEYDWIEYPQYDASITFYQYDKVDKRNEYGVLSRTGKVVCKPFYQEIQPFANGYAVVGHAGTYGYIDEQGANVSHIQFNKAANINSSMTAKVTMDNQEYDLTQMSDGWFAVLHEDNSIKRNPAQATSSIYLINDTDEHCYIHYRSSTMTLKDNALTKAFPPGAMIEAHYSYSWHLFISQDGFLSSAKNLVEMGGEHRGKWAERGYVLKLSHYFNGF